MRPCLGNWQECVSSKINYGNPVLTLMVISSVLFLRVSFRSALKKSSIQNCIVWFDVQLMNKNNELQYPKLKTDACLLIATQQCYACCKRADIQRCFHPEYFCIA